MPATTLRRLGGVMEGDGVPGLGEEEPALDQEAGEGDQGGYTYLIGRLKQG